MLKVFRNIAKSFIQGVIQVFPTKLKYAVLLQNIKNH